LSIDYQDNQDYEIAKWTKWIRKKQQQQQQQSNSWMDYVLQSPCLKTFAALTLALALALRPLAFKQPLPTNRAFTGRKVFIHISF
jgi:hypothetical protein